MVYSHDHRGQGKSSKSVEELGYIGRDGFNLTVFDAHLITKRIKEKHPNLPVYILAHSFGSFIGQDYITRFGNDIAGIILSGSAAQIGADIKAGVVLSSLQRLIFGEKKKGKLIDKMSFGSHNKGIDNPVSSFDWLSRDAKEVKKYCDDPLCGTVFTIGFYYYLFRGLTAMYSPDRLTNIPKKLPIYIMSGDKDPVSHYGETVKTLKEMYLQQGVMDVELKLYPGGRHELINESNRDEVFKNIAAWLNKKTVK